MCIYNSDMDLANQMITSESSPNSAARVCVNLILDQCLQNKAFETVKFYCKKCAITIQ